MSEVVVKNKFFVVALILIIIIGGMTFANLPGPAAPSSGVQIIDGVTFNFADYKALDHEVLALYNYLDTIVSSDYQDYGEWDGWYAEPFPGLHHYVLAFMDYAISELYETTPGYRTEYYHDFAYDLIKKMNTSETEWGEDSIEYKEWSRPDLDSTAYYYPDAENPDEDDVYTGGYRGPANIMWTAHYALMELLYERSFNTGLLTDEITWFVDDWENSLTTDGMGNPQVGGLWENGLIPCEPYIVFVECCSIPIYCTELYDNLYGTQYMESEMWDYGIDFCNDVMQDEYSLFNEGYCVQRPLGWENFTFAILPSTPRGHPMDSFFPDKVRAQGYAVAWSLNFLYYTQYEESVYDYPNFLDAYMKDVSGDQAYIVDMYTNPSGYGTYDMLASLFTLPLAKTMEDYVTLDRIENFLYGAYNKAWENNGREMHFDTLSLLGFLQPIMAFFYIWAHTPVTIPELATARPAAFWDYPYISSADDDYIWVYQAEWDSVKSGFILNIKVDKAATLTFSNFDHTPTAYVGGAVLTQLTPSGNDYTLTLNPGQYQLVIT